MNVIKVFFVFSYIGTTFVNTEKIKITLVINTLNQPSNKMFFLTH